MRTEIEGEFTRHHIYSHQGIEGYEENGERFIYRKNIFGDITAIYKGATKVADYVYDAWATALLLSIREVMALITRSDTADITTIMTLECIIL